MVSGPKHSWGFGWFRGPSRDRAGRQEPTIFDGAGIGPVGREPQRPPRRISRLGRPFGTKTSVVVQGFLGVSCWRLNVYLRAKLECRVFGTDWLLIWRIWGGIRPSGAGCDRYSCRFDIVRHEFALLRSDSTLFRHGLDAPVVNFRFQ